MLRRVLSIPISHLSVYLVWACLTQASPKALAYYGNILSLEAIMQLAQRPNLFQLLRGSSDLASSTANNLVCIRSAQGHQTQFDFDLVRILNIIENQTTWKSALKVSKWLWVSKMVAFQHPAGAPVLPAACAQESNSVPKLSFMVPAWLGQAQNGVALDGIVPNRDISWLIEGLGSNSTPKYTEHKHLATWHFLSLVPLHKSQFPTTVIVVATQFPRKTPIKLQNPWINLT